MQTNESGNEARPRISATVPVSSERELSEAPLLPPKPLPRKDIKARRKRPPPPPPPIITPRREIKSSSSIESNYIKTEKENNNLSQVKNTEHIRPGMCNSSPNKNNIDEKSQRIESSDESLDKESDMENVCLNNEKDKAASSEENTQINKVFEIIEIRIAKGLQSEQKEENKSNNTTETVNCEQNKLKNKVINEQDQLQPTNKVSPEHENSILESTDKLIDESNDEKENCINSKSCHQEETRTNDRDNFKEVFPTNEGGILSIDNSTVRENEDNETYQSLDMVNDDIKNPEINQILENEEIMEEEDTTDESDESDYYWQSNLATIGEEEETSLEYMNA